MLTRYPRDTRDLQFEIIRVPEGGTLYFVSLCQFFEGIETHWNGSRNVMCGGEKGCPFCDKGQLIRYNGYIFGKSLKSDIVKIVHLTKNAAQMLKPQCEVGNGLLGRVIILQRSSGHERKKVQAFPKGCSDVPRAFSQDSLQDQVLRIYRDKQKPRVAPNLE